jgi:hypothetical protein
MIGVLLGGHMQRREFIKFMGGDVADGSMLSKNSFCITDHKSSGQ